jgi:anti-sigma factor RsiW
MACHPLRVSAYVDDELSAAARHEVGKHVTTCPACTAQVAFETRLRGRLALAADVPLAEPLQRRIVARVWRLN